MSEYQYHEFCSIYKPLSPTARKEMHSLSSRACVTTHGASYVYNYSDFRGEPEKLLLKYFDIYFYMTNWGTFQLIFKYPKGEIDIGEIKKYCIEDVISCKQYRQNILLDVNISDEEGSWGWVEGEGRVADLMPLYDEIKEKNYRLLSLASAVNDVLIGEDQNAVSSAIAKIKPSLAQQSFLDGVGFERDMAE